MTRTSNTGCAITDRMFHVKLFAQAKAAKQRVEHVLDSRAPGQPVKRGACEPEALRKDHQIVRTDSQLQSLASLLDERRLPPVQHNRTFSGKQIGDTNRDILEQGAEPLP